MSLVLLLVLNLRGSSSRRLLLFQLSFPLPAWWPVPDLVMNGAGGKIMTKVLDEELETLAEGYIATYDSWRGAVAADELAGDDITQAASRDASAGKRLRSWRPWWR